MNKESVIYLISWLNEQISFTNKLIDQAQQTKNYGKEVQYLAMREAFTACLQKLPNIQI